MTTTLSSSIIHLGDDNDEDPPRSAAAAAEGGGEDHRMMMVEEENHDPQQEEPETPPPLGEEVLRPSLLIPITSSASSSSSNSSSGIQMMIEIFPEEIKEISVSTLIKVLRDEQAPLDLWADAAVLYMDRSGAKEALSLLEEACEVVQQQQQQLPPSLSTTTSSAALAAEIKALKLRLYASAGIAYLTAHPTPLSSSSSSRGASSSAPLPPPHNNNNNHPAEDGATAADQKFTQAGKLDTFFPMTWMGRGMLNLTKGRYDQAKFFFQTTLKQCGPVLPALLGMAAVHFGEGDYPAAQQKYAEAIRRYSSNSHHTTTSFHSAAAMRVGFGLACYRLGQVDRAKAAFSRALALDPEHVEAMVGAALLDMAAGAGEATSGSDDFVARTEKAIKLMSLANLLDHTNAMVQNHLANHYFWKWTPVVGTVSVTQGSSLVHASQAMPLEPGEPIRLGTTLETTVQEEAEGGEADTEDRTVFRLATPWKEASQSGLKVWKKDYERVFDLAKGAYSSTATPAIQAESLFFLARVYHVRGDLTHAHKFYERSVQLAPDLTPARLGWAQTLLAAGDYDAALAQLKTLLDLTQSHPTGTATDILALLGLLQVRAAHDPTTTHHKSSSTTGISSKTSSSSKPSGSGGATSSAAALAGEGLANLRKAIELDPLNPDLVVLEALALQQHPSTYPKALLRYQKAMDLMQRRGQTIPLELYNNLGLLYQETKEYDQSLIMYKQALQSIELEDTQGTDGGDNDAGRPSSAVKVGTMQHPDNDIFLRWVKCPFQVAHPAGVKAGSVTTDLVAVMPGEASADLTPPFFLQSGDWVRVGPDFVSQVVAVTPATDPPGLMTITLRDPFQPDDEEEVDENQMTDETPATTKLWPIAVRRENKLLEKPEVTTVAFNLACLYETTGKTLAAIEIHKGIVKRYPSYVNSYLRLACIAVDCGCLKECSHWLKIAAESAPSNAEVLTLIGNLHLSLCDFGPAEKIFGGLLEKKIPSVEAYASLSMGNIFFATLHANEDKYAKNLQYASDYYKRILQKDSLNAYAANGIGTILAERGEVFKAKEIFNRVREVSGDGIADALLNLGHIYLALKKHPEALQMYKKYMKRAEDGTNPITSKSRMDDVVDVLLYISFAYFDWARHTELFNDANAAPADGRYRKAMEHLEKAIAMNSRKDTLLKYNLCMTKLQAANCVLQKLTRNIPRTVEEVEEALAGLNESLVTVEGILKDKEEGKKKISIRTSVLEDFIKICRANIASAQSHLDDDKKRAAEEETEREIRKLATEAAIREDALKTAIKQREEDKKQAERDQKAEAKMRQVEQLRAGWEQEQAAEAAEKERKTKSRSGQAHPGVEEDEVVMTGHDLFDDSDVEDDVIASGQNAREGADTSAGANIPGTELFGDSDDEDVAGDTAAKKDDDEPTSTNMPGAGATSTELFGDSEEDQSDEELVGSDLKRSQEDSQANAPSKKRRVLDDEDEEDGL